MIKNKNHIVYAVLALLSTLLASFVGSYDTYARCGISTNSVHSYAGAVIDMEWVNDQGQRVASNNTNVRIETYGRTSTPAGNVVRLKNTRGAEYERRRSATFVQYDSGCGDGRNVVLGYGRTSSTDYGAGSMWVLDCDWSRHPGRFQQFAFYGVGVPDGARSGGTWSSEVRAIPNGRTTYITLVYTQPAKPFTWDAAGDSKVNGQQQTTAKPGDTVTFTHVLKNVGRDDYSNLAWRIKQDGRQIASGNSPTVRSNQSYQVRSIRYTIPENTPSGTKVCQLIEHQDSADNGRNESSRPACVSVSTGPPPPPDSDPRVSINNNCRGGCSVKLPNNNVSWSGNYTISDYTPSRNESFSNGERRIRTVIDVRIRGQLDGGRAIDITDRFSRPSGSFSLSAYTLPSDIGRSVCMTVRLDATITTTTTTITRYVDTIFLSDGTKQETTRTERDESTDRKTLSSTSQRRCYDVGNKPRMQVWGGDLRTSGRVQLGYTTNSSSQRVGSWSELAGLIGGSVGTRSTSGSGGADYASGSRKTYNSTKNMLTLANKGTLGNFSNARGDSQGVLDQFRTLAADRVSLSGINGLESRVYRVRGNVTIPSIELSRGKSVVIVVENGSATLAGNIIQAPYSNINEISQLVIVADNIYVRSNVTRLDAWLLSSGLIDTCNVSGNLSLNICNNQLRINGPVYANKIKLKRTYGARGVSDGSPAEIFNLTSDAYLWLRKYTTSTGRVQTTLIRELPPRF